MVGWLGWLLRCCYAVLCCAVLCRAVGDLSVVRTVDWVCSGVMEAERGGLCFGAACIVAFAALYCVSALRLVSTVEGEPLRRGWRRPIVSSVLDHTKHDRPSEHPSLCAMDSAWAMQRRYRDSNVARKTDRGA